MMHFGMPYLLEMQSIEECCELAASLELQFVELNANFPICQVEKLDPARLVQLKQRYGLYFTLHLEEECDPFTFNAAVRGAWLKTARQALQLAAALEMPIVNMHFPHGIYITLPDRKTYLYDQYRGDFRSALADFRQLCEKLLIGTETRLCIENTNGWKPHECAAIEYLLESDVFGLTLDIGHSHGVGNTDEPFFRTHDDRLWHMHGHDARGAKNHLALGDGEIDLAERFTWAMRRNARVVLETKTIAALRQSMAKLPEILSNLS